MRHIKKPLNTEAPEQFTSWRLKHPNAKYYRFKDARIKRIVKDSLIARQKFLCCYCESRIDDGNSHIEHIDPQMGGLSENSMDYSNMAASCIRDPKKNEPNFVPHTFEELVGSSLHCGHARGCNKVVSPYDERCERMFSYSFSGRVSVSPTLSDPDEKELAEKSIEFLRLNVPELVLLRKIAMFESVRMLEAGTPPAAILSEMEGKLPPFYSAAKTAIEKFASSQFA